MNAAVPFLLFRLPKDSLRNVILQVNPSQLFGISLLSTKAKSLMASLDLKSEDCEELTVQVTETFALHLLFPHDEELSVFLHSVEEHEPVKKLGIPESLGIRETGQGDVEWTNSESLSVKQIIDCLKTTFHRSYMELSIGPNAHRYDLESIQRAVGNIDSVWIDSINHEHNQRVVNGCLPTKLIIDGTIVQHDEQLPGSILIQNFNELCVMAPHKLDLNEILLMNSKEINLSDVNISGKELNRFLKLWMTGSNPNLELMYIQFLEGVVVSEEIVYTGLRCEDATENALKEITKKDGTIATIGIESLDNMSSFQMVVWHPHCIAQEAEP